MSTAPFDAAPIVNRLKAEVPTLRLVGIAADYAAVNALQDFPAPCAYVIVAQERGISQPTGHAPRGQQVKQRQMVRVTFGVVVVARNYRDQRGEQVSEEFKTLLGQVRGALMGYVPDTDGARPCEFVQGDLQDYNAGTALWTDVYETQHSIG